MSSCSLSASEWPKKKKMNSKKLAEMSLRLILKLKFLYVSVAIQQIVLLSLLCLCVVKRTRKPSQRLCLAFPNSLPPSHSLPLVPKVIASLQNLLNHSHIHVLSPISPFQKSRLLFTHTCARVEDSPSSSILFSFFKRTIFATLTIFCHEPPDCCRCLLICSPLCLLVCLLYLYSKLSFSFPSL